MKKHTRKLALTRETLTVLAERSVRAPGGVQPEETQSPASCGPQSGESVYPCQGAGNGFQGGGL